MATEAEAKIDHGGFAFPTPEIRAPNGSVLSAGQDGMSLRDWFAGKALASGIIDGSDLNARQLSELIGPDRTGIREEEIAAAIAYRIADAMLKARKAGA